MNASALNPIAVIAAKRDGGELSPEQIDWVIDRYTNGEVAEEQMSALAMAIFLNGMNRQEISRWTAAMIASGERLDLSSLTAPTVDKHSTGGVGDKITLPLTPLVASFGVAVPQLSGRGLGHTGGTLDKLEAIPGWDAKVSPERMLEILSDVGGVICQAGAGLAPADRKLYALRDITSTVESIPLIASSIMSKKIAEGTGALVLDVKVGSGAFMKTFEDASELARTMIDIGTDHGVAVSALLTDMSTPLGRAIGNGIEVTESVEVLAGGGPEDVVELTVRLAEEMLRLVGKPETDVREALRSGQAMDTWRAMIAAQNGDPDAALRTPRVSHAVLAREDGFVTSVDAMGMGRAAWLLGAGRQAPGQDVQAAAGVYLHATVGESVKAGQEICSLYTDTEEALTAAIAEAEEAFVIGQEKPADRTLILDHLTASDG